MADDGLDPYPHEASSISAASEKTLRQAGTEVTKNSQKYGLDRASGSESQVSFDLMKLSSDETTQKPQVEFNFFDSGNVPGSSSRADDNEGTYENTREDKTSEPKTYRCNFCKREFSSSQALGGHQNAHKQERDMVRKRPGIDAGVLGHPHFPYYPVSGPYNRALGVRMDSMIQKPHSYGWFPPRYGQGGRWPSRQTVMNPSLSLDHRLTIESLQAQYGGFGGVLESSANPRVEDSTIPFLHLGYSSNSYVAESSGTAINKPTSTSGGDHHVSPVEEFVKVDDDHEHPGLDLTLKL